VGKWLKNGKFYLSVSLPNSTLTQAKMGKGVTYIIPQINLQALSQAVCSMAR
jgi:hypothetical protein